MLKYAVFILTHGRPDNQKTYKTLKRLNYQGPIYFVVDTSDTTIPEYKARYGDSVIVFDKDKYIDSDDTGSNFDNRHKSPLNARNAVYDIAEGLGFNYFISLDDDYINFNYKFDDSLNYVNDHKIKDITLIFDAMFKYYVNTNIDILAVAQGGDYIGGGKAHGDKIRLKRKAMNVLFCAVDRRISWVGSLNDDVNTYSINGLRGRLFLTSFLICCHQTETQKAEGGITEAYEEFGTYVKSFYTILYAPAGCKITMMGKHKRLHHKLNYNVLMPKILSDSYKLNT